MNAIPNQFEVETLMHAFKSITIMHNQIITTIYVVCYPIGSGYELSLGIPRYQLVAFTYIDSDFTDEHHLSFLANSWDGRCTGNAGEVIELVKMSL